MTVKEQFAKLISVKTIMTFMAMSVFVFLAVTDRLTSTETMSVIIMIVTFYFAKKDTDPADTRIKTETTETKISGGTIIGEKV